VSRRRTFRWERAQFSHHLRISGAYRLAAIQQILVAPHRVLVDPACQCVVGQACVQERRLQNGGYVLIPAGLVAAAAAMRVSVSGLSRAGVGAPARIVGVNPSRTVGGPIPVEPKAEAAAIVVPEHTALAIVQRHLIALRRRAAFSAAASLRSRSSNAAAVKHTPEQCEGRTVR